MAAVAAGPSVPELKRSRSLVDRLKRRPSVKPRPSITLVDAPPVPSIPAVPISHSHSQPARLDATARPPATEPDRPTRVDRADRADHTDRVEGADGDDRAPPSTFAPPAEAASTPPLTRSRSLGAFLKRRPSAPQRSGTTRHRADGRGMWAEDVGIAVARGAASTAPTHAAPAVPDAHALGTPERTRRLTGGAYAALEDALDTRGAQEVRHEAPVADAKSRSSPAAWKKERGKADVVWPTKKVAA
ncbi:hypothetical protein Q5752_001209 [Cryptotrichosporon argae]